MISILLELVSSNLPFSPLSVVFHTIVGSLFIRLWLTTVTFRWLENRYVCSDRSKFGWAHLCPWTVRWLVVSARKYRLMQDSSMFYEVKLSKKFLLRDRSNAVFVVAKQLKACVRDIYILILAVENWWKQNKYATIEIINVLKESNYNVWFYYSACNKLKIEYYLFFLLG